jgi:hypothetical protein
VQGRSDDQRGLLDADSVAGHLLKAGSVFGFLAAHPRELFPDEMFRDLFPTGRGRPSVPADVMAAVVTLHALHGLSGSEAPRHSPLIQESPRAVAAMGQAAAACLPGSQRRNVARLHRTRAGCGRWSLTPSRCAR